MNLLAAKRKLKLRLDAMTQKQYEAVKKCITEGGGLLLSEGIDEREQILLNLQDALEFLFEDCKRYGPDFEKAIAQWTGGNRKTTIACLILEGKFAQIKSMADSM